MSTEELLGMLHQKDATNTLIPLLERWNKIQLSRAPELAKVADLLMKLTGAAKGGAELPLLAETRERLNEWIQTQTNALEQARTEYQRSLRRDLEEYFAKSGIVPHGNYDRLFAGQFILKFNFQTYRFDLWYGPDQEKIIVNKPLPGDSRMLVDSIYKRIESMGSSLAPEAFVEVLLRAYAHATLETKDETVRVPQLLPWVAFLLQTDSFRGEPVRGKFKDYTRADFSHDLFRCHEAVSKSLRFSSAVRSETARRSTYLWVPATDSTEGGYFFSKVAANSFQEPHLPQKDSPHAQQN